MRKRAIVGCFSVLWLGAASARGDNLVLNGDFDTEIAPWVDHHPHLALSWDSKDAANSPVSGSLRVENTSPIDTHGFAVAGECIPLSGPRSLVARALVNLPPGQGREGGFLLSLNWHPDAACVDDALSGTAGVDIVPPVGVWSPLQLVADIPAEAGSVNLFVGFRKVGDGGSVIGHFDGISLEEIDPPPGAWLTHSALPGFEFQVRIGGVRTGVVEEECIKETVCLSGALPGRSEVFLRVVGPKPNGYLWPTIVKFTTASVEVWLRDTGFQIVKYYTLRGASPGFDELPGFFDRFGFFPPEAGE